MDFPRLTTYLTALSENNEKAWFEANRAEFQALRDEFTAFVGQVIARVSQWEEELRWMDPKDCIFRIHRDVRFSGDKRPYKTTFSAYLHPRGRRGEGPGHYFHVDERGTLLVAGGIYMPTPEQLALIREQIAEEPEKVRAVLRRRGFRETFGEIGGERLKRPPRGYSEDTPLIELVKHKSFILHRERDVRGAAHDEVLEYLAESFRAMRPFQSWLRGALRGAAEPSVS